MIITKRAIKKQIAKLEDYILEYKDQIDHLCDEAEKLDLSYSKMATLSMYTIGIILKHGHLVYLVN